MYQALYREYRPKTFKDVLGQDHIVDTLKNQIKSNSIGHAYLFSGTRGTGKTSTAKIFSRAINCTNLQDGNPCNTCESCLGILDESIMDVMEMDAASNRGVNDIRELREKAVYPPSRLNYKVYIIDEVHMLTTEAFNALLKTLEEPPKHLVFILATTEPERIPQTILSRCQRFDFNRMTMDNLILNMKNICDLKKITYDMESLNLIAKSANGAMRDGLSLLDQVIAFSSGAISYDSTIDILGITSSNIIFDLVDNLRKKDMEAVLMEVDSIIQNGKDIHQFLKDLTNHFRNLMIMKTSKHPIDLISVDEETLKAYLTQAGGLSIDFILKSLEILTKADEKIKYSTQPRIILEMSIISLSRIENMDIEERLCRLEESMVAMPRQISEKAPVKTVERPVETIKVEKNQEKGPIGPDEEVEYDNDMELSFDTIQEEWQNILNKIKSQKMNIYALLIEGTPVDYKNGVLFIDYDEKFGFHKQAVSNESNKSFIEKNVSDLFKKKIEIRFDITGHGPKEDKKDQDQILKDVVEVFGEDNISIE